MSWERYRLGDLYEVHNGLSKGSKFFGSGYGFLSFSTVFNNYFIPDELPDLVQSTEKEQESYSIKRGDIFLTRTSETADELGMSCVALKDYPHATYNGFTKRLRPITDKVVPEYIGYYMRMPSFRNEFMAFSTMTTRASLRNEDLLGLKVNLPNLDKQSSIANILREYDYLIENNQKQIKLLEEAAQRLYKEWFVDMHFPGYKNVKIINGIPVGWYNTSVDELGTYLNGFAFKPSDWHSRGKPIIKIKEMKNGISKDTPRNSGERIPSKYIIDTGELLFSWSATLMVMIWNDEQGLLNQHLFKVTPNVGIGKMFLLYSLKNALAEFSNLTTGATMKHIQRNKLNQVFVNVPNEKIMNNFEQIADKYQNQILIHSKINKELSEARNRLLPKLMSGEIEI